MAVGEVDGETGVVGVVGFGGVAFQIVAWWWSGDRVTYDVKRLGIFSKARNVREFELTPWSFSPLNIQHHIDGLLDLQDTFLVVAVAVTVAGTYGPDINGHTLPRSVEHLMAIQ